MMSNVSNVVWYYQVKIDTRPWNEYIFVNQMSVEILIESWHQQEFGHAIHEIEVELDREDQQFE